MHQPHPRCPSCSYLCCIDVICKDDVVPILPCCITNILLLFGRDKNAQKHFFSHHYNNYRLLYLLYGENRSCNTLRFNWLQKSLPHLSAYFPHLSARIVIAKNEYLGLSIYLPTFMRQLTTSGCTSLHQPQP